MADDELPTLRDELEKLRTEKERFEIQLSQQAQELERLRMFRLLTEQALDGLMITNLEGEAIYANDAALQLMGVTSLDALAKRMAEFLGAELIAEQIAALQSEGHWRGTYWATRSDGTPWRVLSSVSALTDEEGKPIAFGALARDITDAYQAEQERLRLQEQVIDTQQAIVRELSTPIIPIAEGVMVMPLIGTIDSYRAAQIMEALLEGIVAHQAERAIIDITGVRVIDTQVASALLRVAQAAKLLGAEVILTGISAEVAQTLIHLGASLDGITTHSSLQQSVALALAHEQL
jgi:rsbT co-antagonist protein RsbR